MSLRILLLALAGAAGIAVIPEILPTGPETGLDASAFLDSGRFAVGAAIIFAGGLLTAMTPCVYPLIPITVSVFGASRSESRLKAVALTSAYVFGMGVVFAALGVLAARTGALFGSVLASTAFVVGLSVFLLILASSMFGAFELALPQGLTQRMNMVGGTGVAGAFLMGSVSGFIAAPCTGPVLTGVLAFVAQSQSSALGAGLLFIYALGIGVPFFLLGVFTIRLPKGGAWMEWVKSILGIALVALAAAYLRDAVPEVRAFFATVSSELGRVPGAAIASAIVFLGVLLGAVHRSFKEGPGQFALKGLAVLLVVGAVLVRLSAVGAPATGNAWVRLGWAEARAPRAFTWNLHFPNKEAGAELSVFETALATAREQGRPVMIDFFAEWCAACKELDHKTYVAENVIAESERFVNIKLDFTDDEPSLTTLEKRYGVVGLPTILFIDSNGEVLRDPKVTGFMGPERFVREMQKVR
jgi:thiol:disulfide interchange protein DsbD